MPQTLTPSFSLGVNYPWSTYGYDFGSDFGVSTPHTNSAVAADFARIRDCGATIVRWFLFGVGNSGIDCSSAGIPRGPHQSLFPDVAAALALARQNNLQICFSLIDFLWLQDPAIPLDPSQPPPVTPIPDSRKILQFAAGREAFLANILIPLFREFRAHPALFAWEIANEPEWAIHEFVPASPATVRLAEFRPFAVHIAQAIREHANVPSTLGSARLLWLPAWDSLGLTIHQAHYYPSLEAANQSSNVASADLATQLRALPASAKPLWLGELPFHDPASLNYSFQSALDTCRAAGLSGAALWRWTPPTAQDKDIALGYIDPQQLTSWVTQNPNPEFSV